MPEGPEVKMYATTLQACVGQSVRFHFQRPRFTKNSNKQFYQQLSESIHTIQHVESHGKQLYMFIDHEIAMVLGFGLTGYIIEGACDPKIHHIVHFEMIVNEETCYYFEDVRRFGTITLLPREFLYNQLATGYDLMDSSITDGDIITRLLKHRHKNITKVLLDQDVVSGCGNYLKCETLYRCQINPFSTIADNVNRLSELVMILRQLMQDSYQRQLHGEWVYHSKQKSAFTEWLHVYGKKVTSKGETILKEKTPDGRSTYYVEFS